MTSRSDLARKSVPPQVTPLLGSCGLPQWLRITVGLREQNEVVLVALRDHASAR